MFFYTVSMDTPLGKKYKMIRLEPGYVIFGHKNNIYGKIALNPQILPV